MEGASVPAAGRASQIFSLTSAIFISVEGQEGESAASPHGKRALAAIGELKHVYGLDYDIHAFRELAEDPEF